ncbi:zinc iron permease [Coniophora puteana RWD-64-598 SS2]|uniref:Zinc iron permease n=1 Tax=Coniophora puteana (strain RWD-64-598) TaxID=741705 RepID=A0A5M3MGE2_CONPW|nr:zinc iron permease [Coniophora puteana RWD-64-598 SS2]EIW78000.1 zinc iron permease [Coniophora puteana RWD-64-598 SS2]
MAPNSLRDPALSFSLSSVFAFMQDPQDVDASGIFDDDGGKDPGKALRMRIVAMAIIFVVSLFASSFPALSKRIRAVRIPRIVFFIGKHFGTGVILSTAFVHLLQDAFESLTDPEVKAKWKIGEYGGLIVLCSLLAIFLVEYISTSFVDQLQAASTPSSTPNDTSPERTPNGTDHTTRCPSPKPLDSHPPDSEHTPLISNGSSNPAQRSQTFHYGTAHHHHAHARLHAHGHARESSPSQDIFEGHHRHERRSAHESHHDRGPRLPSMYGPEEFGQGQVAGVGHVQEHSGHAGHGHDGDEELGGAGAGENECDRGHEHDDEHGRAHDGGGYHRHHHHYHGHHGHHHGHAHGHEHGNVKVGEKRQIVGILVLQLGIMLHSIVVGLTLAITTGPEFASLLIALIFHQLFEGLSLGIRIASLPSSRSSISAAPESGINSNSINDNSNSSFGARHLSALKPVLAGLFAVTTPLGIVVGILVFSGGSSTGGSVEDELHMRLTQGVMSAISAGMLIYAACVEMLAGDFVMDPILWRSGVGRQALALLSLAAGVVCMALVGA